VSHHMSATIPITLKLKSTSLDLSKRDPPGNSQTSLAASLLGTMSLWVYSGVGIVGAGAVVTVTWLLRRRARVRAPVTQPGPIPGPSPAVASA
jgi:hypothetical protein